MKLFFRAILSLSLQLFGCLVVAALGFLIIWCFSEHPEITWSCV